MVKSVSGDVKNPKPKTSKVEKKGPKTTPKKESK